MNELLQTSTIYNNPFEELSIPDPEPVPEEVGVPFIQVFVEESKYWLGPQQLLPTHWTPK